MLGTITRENELWHFKPRFSFELDQSYQVVLTINSNVISTFIQPTSRPVASPPAVSMVVPGDSLVPANILRFFIHFTQPMTKHNAYDHVHILGHNGDTIPDLFYPADPPLWDDSGQRLTLLFDPGRIKTGLQPNKQWGLGLKSNHQYQLVISNLQDYRGTPMIKDFSYDFKTTQADHQMPSYSQWELTTPSANTEESFIIKFDEPLNPAQIPSHIRLEKEGTPWPAELRAHPHQITFISEEPWPAGIYQLMVFNTLEDRAGNSLRKPFEVADGSAISKPQWISIPFQITHKKP